MKGLEYMELYSGTPVNYEHVEIIGGYWKQKQDMVRDVTIDAIYKRFSETGRFDALRCGWKEGDEPIPHIFWESDVAKWIESAAYFLKKQRNPEVERLVDEAVSLMEAYQQPDGYLNVYYTVVEPGKRFTNRTKHELYCLGHLIEAAVAYYGATSKDSLLNICRRYVELIDRLFRVEKSQAFDTPGHEEIELALYKLFNLTGEEKYLALARYFIDTRGTSQKDKDIDSGWGAEYHQSHAPVREQFTAQGHSVRALYLYSAMADLALNDKDDTLYSACEKLFDNITQKRMYITGGVGSTYRGEAFTFDYNLPEYTAYAETCASIALAFFARRMWLIKPDGKYADCAELAIYNTAMAGISLSGDAFFYENPLAFDPERMIFNESRTEPVREHLPIPERKKVFSCSCCPPNISRLIGSIGEYMYSYSGDTVFAQCYMNGEAKIPLGSGELILAQKTDYPYDGRIAIGVKTSGVFTLALRIPAWARQYNVSINAEPMSVPMQSGFVYIKREWKTGDEISLTLHMPIEVMEANVHVRDVCGRYAVMRGPLVYCAEDADNRFNLRDARIGRDTDWTLDREKICGTEAVTVVCEAEIRKETPSLYTPLQSQTEKVTLKLIPYHMWANRGVNEMNVWFLGK